MHSVAPLLLLLFAYSSAIFAAEIPLADPGVGPAETQISTRYKPFVAPGGDGFLVVWEERRFSREPGPLYVRTYDALGRSRQPVAVQIEAGGRDARAVWNGSEFLVVYVRQVSRFGNPEVAPLVRAVRVRADGSLVEGSQVTLVEGRGFASLHALAWDGFEAVTIVTSDAGTRMLALDREGRLLRDQPFAASVSEAVRARNLTVFVTQAEGDAAGTNGEIVAIVDNTSIGVIVSFIDPFHTPRGGFLLAPGGSGARSIAWDGSTWVTSYIDNGAVCTAHFTGANDVARQCNGERSAREPFIATLGARTLLAWTRNAEQVITDGGIASEAVAPQTIPAATLDANGLLAVWREGETVIRIGGLTMNRELRPVHAIQRPSKVDHLRVANAGPYSLLVWSEVAEVRAMRLDANGEPRPPLVTLGRGIHPAIASNGREWLVVWEESIDTEIVSARLTQELFMENVQHYGSPVAQQFTPATAATPGGFLVAWHETESGTGGVRERIVVEPLDAGGLRTTGGMRVVDRGVVSSWVADSALAVACIGAQCLVTWHETIAGISQRSGLIVGADARPLTEPRAIAPEAFAAVSSVIVTGGIYQLFSGSNVFYVAADGTLLSVARWSATSVDLGGAVLFRGAPVLVFARDGRVFVREGSRERAVRH